MDFIENKGWKKWGQQLPSENDDALKMLWEATDSYKSDYLPDHENAFAKFQQKIANEKSTAPGKVVRMPMLSYLVKIAAAVLLVAGAAFFWKTFLSPPELSAIQTDEFSNSIKLPDASEVTLNKSSRLEFVKGFESGKRNVKLEGEGFFNVTKDAERPFSIQTANAKITVLGTSFNVRSYQKENTLEVYVESGKVKVEIENSATNLILGPGELFTYNAESNKAAHKLDKSGQPIAWKTGVIYFKGKPIKEVLAGIQELFGVELNYESEQQFNATCLQTLTVEKGKMAEAFRALERSCQHLHFEQKSDKEYVVTGSCCE